MKKIIAYLMLVFAAVSCLNAELSPQGDQQLPPEFKSVESTTSKECLDVTMRAQLNRSVKIKEAGFYISSNADFTESERLKSSDYDEGDATYSAANQMKDYGKTFYYKAFVSNEHTEIRSGAKSFTVNPFSTFVKATTPVVESSSGETLTLSFDVSAVKGISLTDCGIMYGEDSLSLGGQAISAGKTAGTYTLELKDLEIGKTYFICSYANEGTEQVRSAVLEYLNISVPKVKTTDPSNISFNTAECGGNEIDCQGSDITEKGIVWSVMPNPVLLTAFCKSAGAGNDPFSCEMTGLITGTTYYVRAYVKNNVGIGYGEEKTFTTLVPVSGVSLSKESISIAKNSNYTLIPTITPDNASDKTVSWSTSDSNIASVKDGIVTGKAVGKATITVKTTDGEKTATCEVEVTQKPTGIKLDTDEKTLKVGESSTLKATVTPEDAAQTVTWSSSSSTVASVSVDGVVKALKGGTTTITAETTNGLKATCKVTVLVPVTDVKLDQNSVTIEKNNTFTLKETVSPEDASDKTVSWSSDNESVATVKDGVITGLSVGKTIITVKTTDGEKTATCEVEVIQKPTGISFEAEAKTLKVGETYTLVATISPEDAVKTLTWTSSDDKIASVSKDGEVKALKSGTATITAETINGLKATCTITVIVPVTGVKLNQTTISISENSTYTLVATISPEDASDKTVSWSSSDSNIATVENGVVTGKSKGTATITVKTKDGEKTATCDVEVTCDPTDIKLNIESTTLKVGESTTLEATITPDDATKSITWSSSNTSVASVSEGIVQALSCGTTIITAETVNGLKSTCNVDVFSSQGTDLSSGGTANCYIVNQDGDYKFKGTVKGNSTESVGAPVKAEVLWETFGRAAAPSVGDIISVAVLYDGYVCFSVPENSKNGNAVIAVKDATGTVLWSWHIWVCKGFDPTATAHVYNNAAGVMMDRNLGATSATPGDPHALGLLYQWGRKDPFLGSSSIYESTVAASTLEWPSSVKGDEDKGTIEYAVAHPTTYITAVSNGDWYYSWSPTTDQTRWQTTKTIYDPCPSGWRIPDGGNDGIWAKAFGTTAESTNSKLWNSTCYGMNLGSGNGQSKTEQLGSASVIWYPACGYRQCDTGKLYDLGSGGHYWAINFKSLEFSGIYSYGSYDVTLYPVNEDWPGNANPVRCIKEGSSLEPVSGDDWIK